MKLHIITEYMCLSHSSYSETFHCFAGAAGESTGYLQWICFTVCCKNLTCCSQLQTYLRLVALTLHVIKGYLHPGKYKVFTVSLFPCLLPHGTICVFLKIIEWPPKFTLIKITMKTWRRLVRCIKNEWQLLHWSLAIYTTVTMHCENSLSKWSKRRESEKFNIRREQGFLHHFVTQLILITLKTETPAEGRRSPKPLISKSECKPRCLSQVSSEWWGISVLNNATFIT